jgi:hypothetical protein
MTIECISGTGTGEDVATAEAAAKKAFNSDLAKAIKDAKDMPFVYHFNTIVTETDPFNVVHSALVRYEL